MKNKIYLTFTILILSLIFIFIAPQSIHFFKPSKSIKTTNSPYPEVARITQLMGVVETKEINKKSAPLKKGDLIAHLSEIIIHPHSQIQIQTRKGSLLHFFENSRLIIERWNPSDSNSPLYIHVEQGQFKTVNTLPKDIIYILKDKTLFNPQSKTAPLVLNKNENTPMYQKLNQKPLGEKSNQLSNATIDNTILKYKDNIQRCHLNRVKETGLTSGEVILGLVIKNKGSVSDIKILKDSLNDPVLVKCLETVFYRIPFQEFDGDPIYRSIPLQFQ